MALTIAEVVRSATRNKRVVTAKVTLDNSYPTGGEALTAAMFGLEVLDTVIVPSTNVAGTRLLAWDQDNKKVKVFTALSTEATNASDQSSVVFTATAIGN